MTLIEMLRANGSWEADAAVTAIQVRDRRIEKLETALRKISREQTLWGAMRKAQHALGEFDRKALEGKDG